MNKRRLFIIHPFVQAYRRGLYNRLYSSLQASNIELHVVANRPPPSLRDRGDAISAHWTQEVPCKWYSFMGKEVAIRSLRSLEPRTSDLFIVEQAIRNLETYSLMAQRGRVGYGVAMWGHGRSFSTPQSRALAEAKMWLTRRADWFFAYTNTGAKYVADHGFPRNRISILNNTIDTDELRTDLRAVTAKQTEFALQQWKLTPGRTALFIGGVDSAKGIDFLLEAARIVGDRLPGFRLLIGGSGSATRQVSQAEADGYPVCYLGRLEGHTKALALRVCDLLMIPQWIGLVAVDSLVAGRPIISTIHSSHSPEKEYLIPNRNAIFSESDIVLYAGKVIDTLRDRSTLGRMQVNCEQDSATLSINGMVANFESGINAWQRTRLKH